MHYITRGLYYEHDDFARVNKAQKVFFNSNDEGFLHVIGGWKAPSSFNGWMNLSCGDNLFKYKVKNPSLVCAL